LRGLAVASISALLLVSLGASAALAAPGNGKGQGGGGSGGGTTTSATIYATCNPCLARTVVQIAGRGFIASQGVAQLNVAGAITSTAVYADGTISFGWPYFYSPGSYSVKAYQKGSGGKLVLMAETTITIQ
jgi:hypothetical protein